MAQFGHLVSGAAWSIAGKIVQFLLGLITLAVVARLVGPEAYGIYALAWLVLGIFDIVIGGGPTDTLVQRREVSRGHFNATFWATMVIAIAGFALVWSTAPLVSGWLQGGAVLAAILPIRAVVFLLRALGVGPGAQLLRESRFRDIAKAELVASVLSNLVGLGMALSGAGIWSLVGMEITRQLVITVAAFVMSGWRPGFAMRWSDFTDLLAFNASTWGSWGMHYVRSQLPRLLIGTTLGAQALGYYALAQRLCDQVTEILVVPSYNVVQAGVARNQDDRHAANRLTFGALSAISVVASPLFMGLVGLAPVLVPTVFGPKWVGAVPIVQLLMTVGVLNSVAAIHAAVIRGMGKPHWEMFAATSGVVLAAGLISYAVNISLEAATIGLLLSCLAIAPLEAVLVR